MLAAFAVLTGLSGVLYMTAVLSAVLVASPPTTSIDAPTHERC
jgi:hypothetical protein